MHEARQTKLEVVAVSLYVEDHVVELTVTQITLVTVLVGLVAFLLYALYANQSFGKKRQSRALHFTIPILSPFASVVCHPACLSALRSLNTDVRLSMNRRLLERRH